MAGLILYLSHCVLDMKCRWQWAPSAYGVGDLVGDLFDKHSIAAALLEMLFVEPFMGSGQYYGKSFR